MISVEIENTGPTAGAEVAQLYIGLPDSAPSTPPKQLRGFQKLNLAPRQRGRALFELTRRDVSFWDDGEEEWIVPRGQFRVYVGGSSRDIREDGSFWV